MPVSMEELVRLCKARGFVFPSAEIYGGFRSTYDYGPLGVLMARNVKEAWWRSMVQLRREVVGLDAAVLSSPKIWEASGHLKNFTDPLVDCRTCKQRWRADQLPTTEDGKLQCPNCGGTDFTEARPFNLMFKTFVGPVEDEGAVAYLRPETAQGHFVNFANVLADRAPETAFRDRPDRQVLPQRDHSGQLRFPDKGVRADGARVLRPARRSASAGSSTGATSVSIGTSASASHATCCDFVPTAKEELSHYSAGTADVEFAFPWGWGELEGIANRTDYDLKAHSKGSGETLEYFDATTGLTLRPVRDRACRRRSPHDDGLPDRRLYD